MIFEGVKKQDVETLRRMARLSEAHWGYDETFMEKFDRMFNITEDFIAQHPVFAAREQGEVVAFWGLIQDSDRCELEYFYIAEKVLNQGYGRLMWEHLLSWCRSNGIGGLAFVTSWEAVGFYEKMGAVQDGITQSSIDGRDIPHFVYRL